MKTVFGIALFLAVSPAFAGDTPCMIKQKNAASFELAQNQTAAVQTVEVVLFQPGIWTQAIANNVGSDIVTVRVSNRLKQEITKTYNVGAKQIGESDDCTVARAIEHK